MNFLDRIIQYEDGEMEWDEVVSFFQDLMDTGFILNLQGHYQRTAQTLILASSVVVKGQVVDAVTVEVLDIVNKLHVKLGHKKNRKYPTPSLRQQRGKDESKEEILDVDELDGADDGREPVPAWAKKLYRKIATLTHPDRGIVNGLSEKELEENSSLIRSANTAMSDRKWGLLIDIAAALEITEDLTKNEDFLLLASNRELELAAQINEHKISFFWHWWQYEKADATLIRMINAYMESAGYEPAEAQIIIKTLRETGY